MSDIRLEYVTPESLIPYVKNPRKNDAAVEPVAKSIKEFGFKIPILVDEKHNKNEIIAGHTRLKAALLLGLERVPVIFTDDLTPEQIKALRLTDNKTGEYAEWDRELLVGELSDLRDIGIDLDITGFSAHEVEGFLSESVDLDDFFYSEEESAEQVAQMQNGSANPEPGFNKSKVVCPSCGEEFFA